MLLSSFSLASCATNLPDEEEKGEIINHRLYDFKAQVNQNRSYDIEFKCDDALNSSFSFFVSEDKNVDNDDVKVDVIKKENSYEFEYNSLFNNFYLLAQNDESNHVEGVGSIQLPSINLIINEDDTRDEISEVITFDTLHDGKDFGAYLDFDTFKIYRSEKEVFDENEAEIVVNDGSIFNEKEKFVVTKNTKNNYFYTMTYGTTEVISGAYKAGEEVKAEGVNISNLLIENDSISLEGTLENNLNHVNFGIINNNDYVSKYSEGKIKENEFTIDFDLSQLTDTSETYDVFLSTCGGLFSRIDYSFVDESDRYTQIGSNVLTLIDVNGNLGISLKKKKDINIVEATFAKNDAGYVVFKTFGIFDKTQLSSAIESPKLAIYNKQYGVNDVKTFNVTIDEENGLFSVDADLNRLEKEGYWYDISLYLDGRLQGNEFINEPTYTYKIADCNNIDQLISDEISFKAFNFENYEDGLKICFRDSTNYIKEINFVHEDEMIYLNFKGVYTKSDSSYLSIFRGSISDRIDERRAIVSVDENKNFEAKIRIDDIQDVSHYSIFWFYGSSSIELTSRTYGDRPTILTSDENNYLYSIVSETLNSTNYYKLLKDNEISKLNYVEFISGEDSYLNLKGIISKEIQNKELFVVLEPQKSSEGIIYNPISVDENRNFSCSINLKTISKKYIYYSFKLVEFVDLQFQELSKSGFYFLDQNLPDQYSSHNQLITEKGTYRLNASQVEGTLNRLRLFLS